MHFLCREAPRKQLSIGEQGFLQARHTAYPHFCPVLPSFYQAITVPSSKSCSNRRRAAPTALLGYWFLSVLLTRPGHLVGQGETTLVRLATQCREEELARPEGTQARLHLSSDKEDDLNGSKSTPVPILQPQSLLPTPTHMVLKGHILPGHTHVGLGNARLYDHFPQELRI